MQKYFIILSKFKLYSSIVKLLLIGYDFKFSDTDLFNFRELVFLAVQLKTRVSDVEQYCIKSTIFLSSASDEANDSFARSQK